MPKKYIFYLVGLLLLAVAGIYGFTKWTEAKEKVNLWTLVPEDAVFILESANHTRFLHDLQKEDYWENIVAMQSVGAITDNIAVLDSLAGRNEGASRFLKRKTVLTSLHVVSKTDFDFVFYIPVNTVGEHRFVRTLAENIGKSQAFIEKAVAYQSFQITSIRNQRIGDTFYYFSYHNNIIISSNFDLIKEIIRKINREQLESPAAEFAAINYLNQSDVFAHIFVNYRYLPPFLNVFLKDNLQSDITFLASLCRNSMLGLKRQQNKFIINGFSNPEPLKGSFYNQVKEQAPQAFNLRQFLPSRTAFFLHMGVSQVRSLRQLYAKDRAITWPEPLVAVADSLGRTFTQELGVAYLETNGNPANSEKVIFARSPAGGHTATLLRAVITQATVAGTYPPGTERYQGYLLQQVPVPQFPLLLFGSLARGFEQCYVTQIDDYFLFAPDAASLRSVLADIKAGRVWSEVEAQKLLLETTQQEANFSLYLNTRLAWRMLNRQVRENKRSSLLRNESLVKKFSQLALQFSLKEQQYYTTFVATHPETVAEKREMVTTFETQNFVSLPQPILSAAVPIAPDPDLNTGFLLQDENLDLHRIGNNGQLIWSDSLEEAVVSPVYQVYIGPEKSAKQLFATSRHLYCLDQNGRSVENFPFNLPDTVEVRHLAVFDFKQNRDYRFLINDQSGSLFMFDREGNLQNGWSPKVLESPLVMAPQAVNINGKEVVLAVEQNGYIYAFTPRGEVYPGFPIDLETNISPGVFIKAGTSFKRSLFTVVTQAGQRITINFSGKVVQRKAVPNRKVGSTYELLPAPENKSYIISKQEAGRVSLFDENLRRLLERNFITSSRKLLQYFDFGPLNRIYILTETGPRKTYVYNYQAKLIGQQALNNRLPVTVRFNANTNIYTLFLAEQKEMKRINFRDK